MKKINDKTIESLQILKNSWEVSLRNSLNKTEREINQDVVESLDVALDTMRKYQKIEEIMHKEYTAEYMDVCLVQRLAEIREVIEDGSAI